MVARTFSPIVRLLENKYYMDWFQREHHRAGHTHAGPGPVEGRRRRPDRRVVIDGGARTVVGIAALTRYLQTEPTSIGTRW